MLSGKCICLSLLVPGFAVAADYSSQINHIENHIKPVIDAMIYDPAANTRPERNKFAGTYDVPELGTLVLSVSDQGLLGIPDFYPGTYTLLPESKNVFFNIETGTQFRFRTENGEVVGFDTDRVNAIKID